MSKYLPYSGQHSIQEAKIALHFLRESGQQDVERAQCAAETDLRDELPRAEEIRGSSVRFDVTNPNAPAPMSPVPDHLAGFELTRIRGDSRPSRALRLLNNLLEVSILDYERWDITREDSIRYIRTVLSALPLDVNPIMAVNLQFVDRYAFNGAPDDVDVGLLLQEGSHYIARNSFAAGALWHCHTGWFDVRQGGRALNHLNIGSTFVNSSPTVTIDHNAVFQLDEPRQSTDALLRPSDENNGLVAILDCLP